MKTIEYLKKNGVDLNKCLELFGDVETYNETLKGFHKSIDGKLKQLDAYYKEQDMPNYAIFVHSIKSDCKYFGFMKLANIAFEHEMASKDNDINFVREHYKELTDEANKVKTIVNEYLMDENGTANLYADYKEPEVKEEPTTVEVQEPEHESAFAEINIDELPSGTIITDSEVVVVDEDNNVTEEVLVEAVEINEITTNVSNTTGEDIILVADDSEVVRIFVEKAFKDKYEIARAANGLEALEIIKEHEKDNKIKAILLDLNMPKLDGFAVLDYMTECDLLEKMPVTIISGDSSKEAISRAFTYQIVDMLNKPFSEQKIREAVEKTIR
ncbi:MAG: response regulator [Firmicutes bacterium]|nr:response regulator [Bacillota bacterium]